MRIRRSGFLKQSLLVVLGMLYLTSVATANEQQIKVGLLTNGEGAHLQAYYQSLANAEEVGQVVLADPDGKIEEPARKVLGEKLVKVYADHNILLAQEKPTMALVSLEAKLAPAVIEDALKANCHVFAEKPACVNANQFTRMAELARKQDRQLMLAFSNRLSPVTVEAKRLIASGALGKLYGLEMHLVADQTRLTNARYQKSWLADKNRAGGGHLTWLGIHWLDLASFITDSKITHVTGFSGNVGGQPINIEDSVAMSLRFDNGTFGTLTSGYYLKRSYHSHIKIWGADGWLKISTVPDAKVEWQSINSEEPNQVHTFIPQTKPNTYHTFVRSAVRASAGLEEFPITTEESLHTIKAVYGLYDAANTGKTQSIK